MKRMLLIVVSVFLMTAYGQTSTAKVPVYVWFGVGPNTTSESLANDFAKWKQHGVVGVCANVGFNAERARMAAIAAKAAGLEFHAWIPTMLQGGKDSTWYTVNRLGESAYDKPAYVPYYKTLDPRNPEVQKFLIDEFSRMADIPEIDYIQLDYIRYADVILSRGLWKKYGLVMDEEYPKADYCYCDRCVSDFKKLTGIDIKKVKDPSKCKKWAQFRCDAITDLVNKIAACVHAKGKKLSADVFPGPYSHAVWMVRQEWNKWEVDAYFPMNYNDFYLQPASWAGKITKEEVKTLKGKKPVYSGLFICRDWRNKESIVDPEGSGLLPSEIEKTVASVMKAGAAGICLFSADSMTDEHWAELDKAINKDCKKR